MPNRVPSVRLPPENARPKNRLLAGLPPDDFNRLRPHLLTRPATAKQVFHALNQPVREVIFPNGGVASVTAVMTDGAMVEIATVGDEGFLGITALFGTDMVGSETMMQVPDTSVEVLSVEIFRQELERRGPFFDVVTRYSQGYLLLMTHDRVRREDFHLSHEFLAMMLGSTRPTVTVVAGTLQKAGFIKYVHGRITILNRAGLEEASCECYRTVKGHFDRLGLWLSDGPCFRRCPRRIRIAVRLSRSLQRRP